VDLQLLGDLRVGVTLVGAEEDLKAVQLLAGQGLAAELLKRLALLPGQADRERLGPGHSHLRVKRWQGSTYRN
jgi:hypothetical protein